MAIKTERVMLALFTDEDGRQIVAGASLDESGRDWFDVVMTGAIRRYRQKKRWTIPRWIQISKWGADEISQEG